MKWFKGEERIKAKKKYPRVVIDYDVREGLSVLLICEACKEDEGDYTVRVTNQWGWVTHTVKVTVTKKDEEKFEEDQMKAIIPSNESCPEIEVQVGKTVPEKRTDSPGNLDDNSSTKEEEKVKMESKHKMDYEVEEKNILERETDERVTSPEEDINVQKAKAQKVDEAEARVIELKPEAVIPDNNGSRDDEAINAVPPLMSLSDGRTPNRESSPIEKPSTAAAAATALSPAPSIAAARPSHTPPNIAVEEELLQHAEVCGDRVHHTQVPGGASNGSVPALTTSTNGPEEVIRDTIEGAGAGGNGSDTEELLVDVGSDFVTGSDRESGAESGDYPVCKDGVPPRGPDCVGGDGFTENALERGAEGKEKEEDRRFGIKDQDAELLGQAAVSLIDKSTDKYPTDKDKPVPVTDEPVGLLIDEFTYGSSQKGSDFELGVTESVDEVVSQVVDKIKHEDPPKSLLTDGVTSRIHYLKSEKSLLDAEEKGAEKPSFDGDFSESPKKDPNKISPILRDDLGEDLIDFSSTPFDKGSDHVHEGDLIEDEMSSAPLSTQQAQSGTEPASEKQPETQALAPSVERRAIDEQVGADHISDRLIIISPEVPQSIDHPSDDQSIAVPTPLKHTGAKLESPPSGGTLLEEQVGHDTGVNDLRGAIHKEEDVEGGLMEAAASGRPTDTSPGWRESVKTPQGTGPGQHATTSVHPVFIQRPQPVCVTVGETIKLSCRIQG